MKLLAKSTLAVNQTEARKSLPVEGIEIIFLGGEIENLAATRKTLFSLADHFEVIGLEAPCEEKGLVINPLTSSPQVVESRDYLLRCIDLVNELHHRGTETYFQYQFSFENFDAHGKPQLYGQGLLEEVVQAHQELRGYSDVSVQIENGIPIGVRRGAPAYFPWTARLRDFDPVLPLALDICHLAITIYTWSQAGTSQNGLYPITTPYGHFWIEMTEEDRDVGQKVKAGESLQDAITAEVVRQIKLHAPIIGSLQFSNARAGVGTNDLDEGYAGTDGLLDIPRVFREGILDAEIPYLIPEYQEKDYTNPVCQRQALDMVRALARLNTDIRL